MCIPRVLKYFLKAHSKSEFKETLLVCKEGPQLAYWLGKGCGFVFIEHLLWLFLVALEGMPFPLNHRPDFLDIL